MKIIIAMFGCLAPPYGDLIKAAKETWASVPHPHVTTIFFYGGDKEFRTDLGNDVWEYGFRCPDRYDMQAWKFKKLLDVLPKVDFIASSSTAQYLDKKMLYEKAETLPRERCYYGRDNFKAWPGECPYVPYVSGAGRIISSDVADILRDNTDETPGYEDVQVGEMLAKHGIPILDDGSAFFDFKSLKDPFNDPFPRHFNYRCKIDDDDREKDARLFYRIFERCK